MCHPEASSRLKEVLRSVAIMEMYTIICICADLFPVNPSLRVFEIPAYSEKSSIRFLTLSDTALFF